MSSKYLGRLQAPRSRLLLLCSAPFSQCKRRTGTSLPFDRTLLRKQPLRLGRKQRLAQILVFVAQISVTTGGRRLWTVVRTFTTSNVRTASLTIHIAGARVQGKGSTLEVT